MAVYLADIVMDQALNYIKNNVTEMYICSNSAITTRGSALTTDLAQKTGLSAGSFTGPADGDTNGRKITKDAETAIPISTTGTARVVAFTSATTLIWKVDVTTPQTLTDNGTVDTSAVDHEIADTT